eukprot:CAMPEP_0204572768 /NCGR_PEP_ID=MMETSP0661-20131031/39644_1 /ASSEMBLY_ACC=CAM_ASM_000606 /TAXON_ID=109239 /ORGANISM="Alexandrium margalefi, Strain AMGDE01CS-322" /LENGTH=105 /DNA_ID=CAMNT_0051581141 /DNA_START=225 /DNA_END=542 /DNA_ORIENTATION=+
MTASIQPSTLAYFRFPLALARFETILPRLFRISPSLVTPPTVFSLRPRNTSTRANLPRATFDTRLAFMAFIALAGAAAFMESFGSAMPRSGAGRAARDRQRRAGT